jgi:hypothetical protein
MEEGLLAVSTRGTFEYGYSVSIDGDYAIVGICDDEIACLFRRSGTSWTQQGGLIASGGSNFSHFGRSVSIDGECIVLGAPGAANGSGANSGVFYVSTLGGAMTKFTASDGDVGDNFGYAVCASGDYIVVGAPEDDDLRGRNCGSAYIFKRQGASWVQQAKLTGIDSAYDDLFGCAVSIDGDYVIVGAQGNDSKGPNCGAAYIFKRTGDTWSL